MAADPARIVYTLMSNWHLHPTSCGRIHRLLCTVSTVVLSVLSVACIIFGVAAPHNCVQNSIYILLLYTALQAVLIFLVLPVLHVVYIFHIVRIIFSTAAVLLFAN